MKDIYVNSALFECVGDVLKKYVKATAEICNFTAEILPLGGLDYFDPLDFALHDQNVAVGKLFELWLEDAIEAQRAMDALKSYQQAESYQQASQNS